MPRIYNFNAGPAILPAPVLAHAQEELRDYRGTGMSMMEMSHRSPEYEAINNEAEQRIRHLLKLEAGYRVLFLQGGASGQFAMLPMNFLPAAASADYIVTGTWGEKAVEEARKLGNVHVAADTQAGGYRRVPAPREIRLGTAPAYVHITSNETIQGVQWPELPSFGDLPVAADMSSDMLSRPFDATRFALIYAGAQKNLGPAGVTVVIIRESWLAQASQQVSAILSYATHAKHSSLYNTPPVFPIYMLNLVLAWIEGQGGLAGMARRNEAKARVLYDTIDASAGFYTGHAETASRSRMNVTFRLPSEQLEAVFVAEAKAQGMVGLAGHRSVGGIRASIYNAMEQDGCEALAAFMRAFAASKG
jgi:phosphoserine aminotransferase